MATWNRGIKFYLHAFGTLMTLLLAVVEKLAKSLIIGNVMGLTATPWKRLIVCI